MRVGLGCLRIPAEGEGVLRAALDAGITTFDTARAYPGSEEMLGRVLRAHPRGAAAFVVTKCGMRRSGARWEPDGRAAAIAADARASVEALGRPIDVLLLHAPDPRVPLATSLRALVRIGEQGLARAVGVSNVSHKELEQAAAIARIDAVEVALGAYDDEAARGGLVTWCAQHGARLFAHAPLGGPARAPRLAHDGALRAIAERHGVDAGVVVLAYLLAVHPSIEPIVGASRPETIARIVSASRVALDEADLAALDARFPRLGAVRRPPPAVPADAAREVVVLMGIAGAGKSRIAEQWVARGYERLNRDALGGTLRGIAKRLDETLAAGAARVVLDNTYVTRASRADVVRIAHAHGAAVRCVHVATTLADAEINVVSRMLDRHGELLAPDAIRAASKKDPNVFPPGALFRMVRELEPPSPDEGFASVETVPFVRDAPPAALRPGAALPLEVLAQGDVLDQIPADVPMLVFAWRPPPDAASIVEQIASRAGRPLHFMACAHDAGRPTCWCRPPLPGLWLAFARRVGVGRFGSVMFAASAAHRTMARNLGLRIVE